VLGDEFFSMHTLFWLGDYDTLQEAQRSSGRPEQSSQLARVRARRTRQQGDAMNSAIISRVMREMGRKGGMVGGRSKSPAKVSAARENGKKGGRPKKSPRK
jgi:general stress protein YciG